MDAYVDTIVDLDIPIVLGSPFQYQVQAVVSATTGHLAGSLSPFTGISAASYVGSFVGASVLDAQHQLIPGAPISVGESGFDYAPEPDVLALRIVAVAALALRRRFGRSR